MATSAEHEIGEANYVICVQCRSITTRFMLLCAMNMRTSYLETAFMQCYAISRMHLTLY